MQVLDTKLLLWSSSWAGLQALSSLSCCVAKPTSTKQVLSNPKSEAAQKVWAQTIGPSSPGLVFVLHRFCGGGIPWQLPNCLLTLVGSGKSRPRPKALSRNGPCSAPPPHSTWPVAERSAECRTHAKHKTQAGASVNPDLVTHPPCFSSTSKAARDLCMTASFPIGCFSFPISWFDSPGERLGLELHKQFPTLMHCL